jgi:hypothetical protein
MMMQRMELKGAEKAKYFSATIICVYLATLCAALIVTSAVFSTMQDATAVTAAGLFGLVMSGLLGLAFFCSQRRELRYDRIVTSNDADTNFRAVRASILDAQWRVTSELPDRQLDAQTADSRFTVGERVQIRFVGSNVLVASICDPSVGFSLVGRRRCAEHRDFVRSVVLQSATGSRNLTAET